MSATNRSRSKIIWGVLAVLLVMVAVIEFNDRSSPPVRDDGHGHSSSGPSMLMPAPMEEIDAIEIAAAGNLHRFSRDANNAWFYHGIHAGPEEVHEHVPDPVMSEIIGKSFGLLGRARIERRFELTDDDPFGVTKPEMIILVYVTDLVTPRIKYSVGDLAPDELSRYVHIVAGSGVVSIPGYKNPYMNVVSGSEVVSIPDYHIRNLRELLETATAQPSEESTPAS